MGLISRVSSRTYRREMLRSVNAVVGRFPSCSKLKFQTRLITRNLSQNADTKNQKTDPTFSKDFSKVIDSIPSSDSQEKPPKSAFVYASACFAFGSLGYALYTYYNSTKFKNDANKIFQDSCERLRKLPGMKETVFHTDIDDKNTTVNPMHMSSYSEKLNTDFIRVMFFASMNTREAVIITEYAKHRTNGHLIPRIIMATIDPNTDYEQVKILEDNRQQTDGDQNLGIIAGDEIPDDQLVLVENKTWDNLMNPAYDPENKVNLKKTE